MKDKFYPRPSNFFKIARTIFGVIILQDFAAPSLQNGAFEYKLAGLANGKHSLSVPDLSLENANPKADINERSSCLSLVNVNSFYVFQSDNFILIFFFN